MGQVIKLILAAAGLGLAIAIAIEWTVVTGAFTGGLQPVVTGSVVPLAMMAVGVTIYGVLRHLRKQ